MLKVEPQKLVIVSHIEPYEEEQKEFTLVQQVCDILTCKGYCVRRSTEFQQFQGTCGNAITTRKLHEKLVDHPTMKNFIPLQWMSTCRMCQEKNENI